MISMLIRIAARACANVIPTLLVTLLSAPAVAGDRLLATGGVMNVEGSAGGGLTPWALIAGLGTDKEVGASAFCTRVDPSDFNLESCGAALGIDNRVEVSAARQRFDLENTAPGHTINQTIFGLKLRVLGDAVIDQDRWWPQLALGAQFKHNSDYDFIPQLIGAKHADGTDLYVASTKAWLAGPFGRTWIADLTLRDTEANQMGLLGFGGDRGDYHLVAEGSLGMFVTDWLILGAEYRQKPNNLSAFREDDFKDVFLVWIPVKYASLTVGYADLGNIANHSGQAGSYVSLQGSW